MIYNIFVVVQFLKYIYRAYEAAGASHDWSLADVRHIVGVMTFPVVTISDHKFKVSYHRWLNTKSFRF